MQQRKLHTAFATNSNALLARHVKHAHVPLKSDCKCPPSGVPQKIETTPLTEVHVVSIKLLTLKELQLITEQGAAGRQKLDALFEGSGRLVSSLSRPSVV